MTPPPPALASPSSQRVQELCVEHQDEACRQTNRIFLWLMPLQWIFGIATALILSPRAWSGPESWIHWHVWAAIFFGGLISGLPLYLILLHPRETMTRHVVAIGQMLTSSLLIHLTGGRIETHFHIFGSLAFLAFYLDWKVIATATVVVVADHFLRGIYWPGSIFGTLAASHWRWLEHAGWVLFEDVFLLISIRNSLQAKFVVASHRAKLEELNAEAERKMDVVKENAADLIALNVEVERQVRERTAELSTAHHNLHRVRELFQLITENAADLIAVVDSTGQFLYSSPSYGKFLGGSESALPRGCAFDLAHPGDMQAMKEALQACAATGKDQSLSYRMKHHDGTWHSFESQCTRGHDAGSGRPQQVLVSRDVTDRKEAEKERQEIELQLRHSQKLESIGQLAAGIAHEINTPTQFISDNTRFLKGAFGDLHGVLDGCRRLLGEGRKGTASPASFEEMEKAFETADIPYLSEEVPKAIQQSLDGLDRVAKIVRAMKDFSHPGSSEKVAFNLNRAIESTLIISNNEWKYVADAVADLDPSLPSVLGLPGEFNQVVLNLIVNAAHAIAERKAPQKGTITLSTRSVPGWIEVRVADTGMGIPEKHREKIFDPFFTTKEVGKGTGQGLSIAHSIIVDKHGGTISFETETGRGTTFTIRLPAPAETGTASV